MLGAVTAGMAAGAVAGVGAAAVSIWVLRHGHRGLELQGVPPAARGMLLCEVCLGVLGGAAGCGRKPCVRAGLSAVSSRAHVLAVRCPGVRKRVGSCRRQGFFVLLLLMLA